MALSDRERRLYARHLLLPELGASGQERLLSGVVRAPANADPEALSIARDYLARAGVKSADEDESALELSVPERARIAQHAGHPALELAASALFGALAATEAIKAIAGIGEPSVLPDSLVLSSEEA